VCVCVQERKCVCVCPDKGTLKAAFHFDATARCVGECVRERERERERARARKIVCVCPDKGL